MPGRSRRCWQARPHPGTLEDDQGYASSKFPFLALRSSTGLVAVTFQLRFSVKLHFQRLLNDKQICSNFARSLQYLVVLLLSERKFRFGRVIEYRQQDWCGS